MSLYIYLFIYTFATRTLLNILGPLDGSPPERIQAIRGRTRYVYRVLLENGESVIFKPAPDEEPANNRDAYVPQDELAVYNRFKSLQCKYIPFAMRL